MRILLLCTAFNSLTQSVYTALLDRGDEVAVAYAISEEQILDEVEIFGPEPILCPFLKQYIPSSIYERYPAYIFDNALKNPDNFMRRFIS